MSIIDRARLPEVLIKLDKLFTERSNPTNPDTAPNRHICKGFTMESVY